MPHIYMLNVVIKVYGKFQASFVVQLSGLFLGAWHSYTMGGASLFLCLMLALQKPCLFLSAGHAQSA